MANRSSKLSKVDKIQDVKNKSRDRRSGVPMKKRKNISTKKMERFLNQARELQWAGKHEQAIEVCTQALEVIGKGSSGTAQIQVELLYTRAESNWALIRSPDEVRNDTNLMTLLGPLYRRWVACQIYVGAGDFV